MLNDTDIDMEELEARLYGQVHYSGFDEDDGRPKTNNVPSNTTNSHQEKGYFTKFQPLPPIYRTYESYSHPHPHPQYVNNNLYGQLGFMLNPAAVNNIVVVQQPPTQIFTNRDLTLESRRINSRQRRRARRAMFKNNVPRFKGFKEHRLNKSSVINAPEEENCRKQVDSTTCNKSVCEIIEPKIDVVVISSDDESVNIKKENERKTTNIENVIILDKIVDGEDVIFVETKQVEIINIDCDDDIPVSNCAISTVSCTEQNDFLEDHLLQSSPMVVEDIDLTDKFDIPQASINAEASDSESSCTTSDSQNRIFREPAFETTSKDVSALSLHDFENYITTSGKFAYDTLVTQSIDLNASSSKVDKQRNEKVNINSSDSSSESDYDDDCNVTLVPNKTNKKLPSLSPIVSDDEVITSGYESRIMEINSSKCKTIQDDSKSEEANTSVFCISSSDELSDLEVDMNNGIELLNIIEGTTVLPKQKVSNSKSIKTVPVRFSMFYSDDMNKFYNNSWGQENFSVEEEQKKMSDDPKMWKIIDEDFTNIFATPKGVRCHRCRQFGHKAVNCTNKSGIPKCILCGLSGHYDSKCPNKLCSACGEKIPFWTIYCNRCTNLRYMFCNICSMRGHTSAHCTDLWRRYHLTVSEGPVIRPKNSMLRLPEDRWCCACASQGHYEHECNYTIRSYPPTSPFVHNYKDVYHYVNQSRNTPNSFTPCQSLNQEVQNCATQPAIPSLLDLKLDESKILLDQPQQHMEFTLTPYGVSRLLSRGGLKFLKNMTKNTDLQIKVLKQGNGNIRKYICMVEGSDCHKSKAVTKIKEYNKMPNDNGLVSVVSRPSLQLKKFSLKTYFKQINKKLPWTQLIKDTHKKILTLTAKLEEGLADKRNLNNIRKTLRLNYTILNAVLICKFNVGDHRQLQLLKQWSRSKTNYADELVQRAYKYVFLNDKNDKFNYEKIIQNMSYAVDEPYDLLKDNIDSMMKSTSELCRNLKLHKELCLLENYYAVIVESRYRRVQLFKKFCYTLKRKNSK